MTGNAIACSVCQQPILFRPARGRKSGKSFVMLTCAKDARHLRGFIGDAAFVQKVIAASGARQGRGEG